MEGAETRLEVWPGCRYRVRPSNSGAAGYLGRREDEVVRGDGWQLDNIFR